MKRKEPREYLFDKFVDHRHSSKDSEYGYAGIDTNQNRINFKQQAVSRAISTAGIAIDTLKSWGSFQVLPLQLKQIGVRPLQFKQMEVYKEQPFIDYHNNLHLYSAEILLAQVWCSRAFVEKSAKESFNEPRMTLHGAAAKFDSEDTNLRQNGGSLPPTSLATCPWNTEII